MSLFTKCFVMWVPSSCANNGHTKGGWTSKHQRRGLKANNLFTWPYHFVIMNEYEGNKIEFCCSLQHGVFLLTHTLLLEREAYMIQASRGCSKLLKFFSLSLKSAAIKGNPSCNVINKAKRTIKSWTSTSWVLRNIKVLVGEN